MKIFPGLVRAYLEAGSKKRRPQIVAQGAELVAAMAKKKEEKRVRVEEKRTVEQAVSNTTAGLLSAMSELGSEGANSTSWSLTAPGAGEYVLCWSSCGTCPGVRGAGYP